MNVMVSASPKPDLWSGPSEACQSVALQSLRGLLRREDNASHQGGDSLPLSSDMVKAKLAFQAFLAAARQVPGAREPNLGEPGSPTPTKDERRLLRALATAQAGDWAVLDNHLYKFALDRRQRAGLTDAVRALATALAASGFMLPALPTSIVPASALRVAFIHGLALDEIEVTWPSTSQLLHNTTGAETE